jgi:5-carboxymethyl-2-hydroxymuconate isomerase
VGDGNKSNAFVHLTLSLMKGRDLSLRKALGEALFACLKEFFAQSFKELNCSFSFEIREMERETYFMLEGGK